MAYGKIYNLQFSSRLNNTYVIEIEKDGYVGEVKDLIGGADVFTTSLGDDDFVYEPLRLSTAKMSVIASDEMPPIYATAYQQYRVTLLHNNVPLWCGFIKPEEYTQDYVDRDSEVEIECISGVSTLEYVNYTQIDPTGLKFVSLKSLLERAIAATKSRYVKIYMPHTFAADVASYGTNALLRDDCLISEQNFFDEENEAMTYKDILEEVCRFSHTTLHDNLGNLYFVDLDYQDAYDEYVLTNNVLTLSSVSALSINTKSVQSIGFGGSGHSLDIIGGYNKATVITSNYNNISKVFPSEDWSTLKTLYDGKGTGYAVVAENKSKPYSFRRKLLEGSSYKAHYYAGTGFTASGESTKEITHWPFNYGVIYEVANEVSEPTQYIYNRSYNNPYFGLNYGAYIAQYADYLDEDPPVNYEYSDIILMHKYMQVDEGRRIAFDPKAYMGLLTFRNHLITAIFSDGAIILSVQVRAIAPNLTCLYDNFSGVFGPGGFSASKVTLTFILRIGDRYFNGSEWTNTASMFSIDTEDITMLNSFVALKTNKTLDMPYNGATGYVIPITGVEKGEVFFAIMDVSENCAIKELKLDFQVVDDYVSTSSKDDNSSDRKYTNVVNSEYVNKLDDITEKISSYNHDGLCYSKLLLGNSFIADNLYEGINHAVVRPEELLLRRIVNQYSEPKIKLTQVLLYDATLKPVDRLTDDYQGTSKKFVIIGNETNYSQESSEIKMIEKE